jgi:hypothetical protein
MWLSCPCQSAKWAVIGGSGADEAASGALRARRPNHATDSFKSPHNCTADPQGRGLPQVSHGSLRYRAGPVWAAASPVSPPPMTITSDGSVMRRICRRRKLNEDGPSCRALGRSYDGETRHRHADVDALQARRQPICRPHVSLERRSSPWSRHSTSPRQPGSRRSCHSRRTGHRRARIFGRLPRPVHRVAARPCCRDRRAGDADRRGDIAAR